MSLMLTRLPGRPSNWDQIVHRYESKTLFHESAWLDHVLTIRPRARIEYMQISDMGQTVGYVCAVRLRTFFLTVLGSPLPGTGTNYMGPLIDRSVNIDEFVAALIRYCRDHRVAHLELAHPWFDAAQLRGREIDVHESVTHVIPLPSDESAAFGLLKSACRNRVRKAEKNGLVAEVTDDPSVVDRFYEQFIEVYGKQGMTVPFGIDRPRSLFEKLHPAGRLLPVWVKNDAEVVAAGLFPYDDRAIYFWGAASWLKDQHLCPNELLQWTVMREAVRRGIPRYNMCGGTSQFKDKFGGGDVPYNHYSRSFVPGLRAARDLYKTLHWQRLKLMGRLKRIQARSQPTTAPGDHVEPSPSAPDKRLAHSP